jgi:hypothetical protein
MCQAVIICCINLALGDDHSDRNRGLYESYTVMITSVINKRTLLQAENYD